MNNHILRRAVLTAMLALGANAIAAPAAKPLTDWPHITSAVKQDKAMEARIKEIVAGMTLAQKVGQMTQPEIKNVTPAQVRQYYIGSVLNGGGSWPQNNKHASAADWVALADAYYEASMTTDMATKIPVIWGIDAMHGNSNMYGATLFPHNIGLGAARDPKLVGEMAKVVARAVRATGIDWVFAPTLAVVRDDRWGRTYESFSEDSAIVSEYAGVYVKGLQGDLKSDGTVVATAKHFVGDGGTAEGKDRGVNQSTLSEMINLHAAGYYPALQAGVQTVMASFNSWNDVKGGVDHGKMHGSHELLTVALKEKMGFDGLVVSDWNAIAEVPGCGDDSCAAAINAGVDLVMVPEKWKSFIANTIAQVEKGEIPISRIDDAVTRILRVKLRAGLFDGKKPSQNIYAGKQEALQALLGWDAAQFDHLVRRLPEPYWVAEPEDVIARNAGLIAEAGSAQLSISAQVYPERGATLVTVYAADHPGLFYRIAGAISVAGGNIIDARIHTTRDGMALDNFLVQDPFGRPFDETAQLSRLKQAIEDALANRGKMIDRLMAKPPSRPRAEAFAIAPNVLIDNKASNRFTVIEINARDRPALLHQLAHALFQSKVTIHSAHVATYGERAVDTFYLIDLTGEKISAASRLKTIERRLLGAAAGERITDAA